jgi:hypothetical protein
MEEDTEMSCPRCGAMPTVQNMGYGRGFKVFCGAHAIRFETWGETYLEAETAWIKYCARTKEQDARRAAANKG